MRVNHQMAARAGINADAIPTVYGAVLERLDTGVILLDAAGHPAFINARASRIVAAADGISADATGVSAASGAATRALRAAVAAVAAGQVPSRRVYLERPSGLAALVVTVIPLDGIDDGAPRVALFIIDPAAPVRIDTHALGAAYGLTPREASIAALLTRGADVAQAAGTLGIGVSSAREYLKRVLDKTGARRQANLVRLVLRGFADSPV
ncbi:hypothetical protein FHP25_20085 [Vineibacter terrae]|uniref:HTH luxR-type domain-containing protein n=1 Tax=Vineibacter terrae TaxID=2586908 RepID=A0A5C8PJ92_9HYPH|nr:hypothetical protein [Vineibacter terrae]TXL73708.1 hypothetical protein FHP25_20085 [Vineibacter terrae]